MEFEAIFTGSFLTFVLLVAAHLILWPYRARLRRVHSYVVGVSMIGVGVTMTAFLLGQWIIAITFWAVSGPGGFAVIVAWWLREGGKGLSVDDILEHAKRGISRAAVPGESDHRRN
jgi:hypothetical protein